MLRWTSIFAVYSAVPTNLLVFVTPAAIISTTSIVPKIFSEPLFLNHRGIVVVVFVALSLTIPVWLVGLVLAFLFGPKQIRDHRNVETYLERLSKSAGDSSKWPATLTEHSREWSDDDVNFAPGAKWFSGALFSLSFGGALGTYLISVAIVALFLAGCIH